ncbi:MAG TPA: protein translocase subunit SecD [Kofleriaceae bacterium]|nr:protein translocase subunit SecD [Kofleriaceae bacterium]
MERSLKWRTFFLVAVTVVSLLMLVPTVAPSGQLPSWFANVFSRKIQLGLDLQGGLHIIYSIDLEKAVDDKGSDIKRELEAKLADAKIKGEVSTPIRPVGAVNVLVEDPKQKGRVREDLMAGLYEDALVVDRDCPPDLADKAVCVRVSSDYAEGLKKAALEQAVHTVRERIDERGVAEPSVVTKGDQIIVELPGLDPEATRRVKDIIQRTAKLEFKMVEDGGPFMEKVYNRAVQEVVKDHPGKTNPDVLSERLTTVPEDIGVDIDSWEHEGTGKNHKDWYLTAKDREELFPVGEARKRGCYNENKPVVGGKVHCAVSGREVLERYLKGLADEAPKDAAGKPPKDAAGKPAPGSSLRIDDDHVWGFELQRPERGGGGEPRWRTYYLRRPVELAGSSVANANMYWNQTTGRPEVLVEFDRWGANRFEDMTGKNVGRKMAIILDDKVSSAPVIQDKIGGGRSSITMGGGNDREIQREAQDLVNVLKTGSLPAPLKVDSESEVGPLLGRDAIDKAKLAFMMGALLVMLVMLYFYRFSGIISIVAVILNILLMLALMAALGATLTLPGIAALVLTTGMAVDANIIIYERIREELRAGKSVKGAVDAGYHRGFAAIFDGHVTTLCAGYVLYQYGSGPIKGFAVMLMIGIFTTLFTQVWCARLFFTYYVGRRRSANTISI